MSITKKEAAGLVARIIIGGIFILAGWAKVSAMAMTVGYFGSIGIPAFLAYFVGYAELIGGIMVVLGFYAYYAELVLAVIMLVAVYYTRSGGFQMFSMPLATLAGLLALVDAGAGRFALRLKK